TVGDLRLRADRIAELDARGAELIDQPAEAAGVAAPSADIPSVQRLAHLHGARGRDRRGASMEVEAGLLPLETDVLEQSPDLFSRRGDERLVLDLVKPRSEDPAPVPHEPVEADVVAADVREIVRVAVVREARREQSSVPRDAGIERVAAHADDPRAGQRRTNERRVEKVERHLVDETRRVSDDLPHAF